MQRPFPLLLRFRDLRRLTQLPERKLLDVAEDLGGRALWDGGKRYFLRPVVERVLLGLPVDSLYGAEPAVPLLRLCEARAWLGLDDGQLALVWLKHPGIPYRHDPNSKPLYRTHLIRERLLAPLVPGNLRT